MFWPTHQMLIIADVHLGKVMHFRKAGIPVPSKIIQKDLLILQQLMRQWKPSRVLFLGDLFHSSLNSEWHFFEELMGRFPHSTFELVLGNHDLYTANFMKDQLMLYEESLMLEPFLFTHIPLEKSEIPAGHYNLCGHLHPAVKLIGSGRQQLQFPCFFFGENQGVLPAFGSFTGFVSMDVRKSDRVFPIVEDAVLDLN